MKCISEPVADRDKDMTHIRKRDENLNMMCHHHLLTTSHNLHLDDSILKTKDYEFIAPAHYCSLHCSLEFIKSNQSENSLASFINQE